jgi:hypothetical protein
MKVLAFRAALAALVIANLGACAAERRNADAILQAREMEWASMRESSYKAVDTILDQMSTAFRPGTMIRVEPLVDTARSAQKSAPAAPLGRVLAEQIAARFTQRGYPVSDVPFTKPPYFLLRGTYSVGEDSVFVNLKLVAPHLGRVVAGHDYALIKDPDLAVLTVPPAPRRTQFFSGSWPE